MKALIIEWHGTNYDIVGEVVRCKDCVHYLHGACDNNEIYMNLTGDLIGVHFEPEPDFYCAFGKRKEK